MNKTNLEHAVFAVVIQLIGLLLYFLLGEAFLSAFAGIMFFLGREHAQREYKIGDPSKLAWYEGFDIVEWSLDAKLDLLFPILACSLVAILFHLKGVYL